MQSHMAPHLHTHHSHTHSHTLSTLTLSHPHTPTNLISLIQLSELLHFVLLQSCRHLFDVMELKPLPTMTNLVLSGDHASCWEGVQVMCYLRNRTEATPVL